MPPEVSIWFPFYVGDYLADTIHLTREQHGAYLLLLCAYWKRGKALPADTEYLASTCKADQHAWSMLEAVLRHFFDTESSPGLWINHRMEEELAKARKAKEKAIDKAKKGANARWGKNA